MGDNKPPYVIAEIGSNHNGDMALCRRLIDAAAEAGAHAVKFQSWTEHSLIAQEEYERNTQYADKKKHFGSLLDMVRAYQFTPDQHVEALSYCKEKGIDFCSSVFSNAEADLLESLEVPFFKIASMDLVNTPLLRYVARKQKPVMLSTGMATLGEIEQAVEAIREEGNQDVILLHCVSIYPPESDAIHLNNITLLKDAFNVPVGFSDHTLGTSIPLAAVALGASVIEKHFTLDKDMAGWDHAISADPEELNLIVEQGNLVFQALGNKRREVSEAELQKRRQFRRSIVARRALKKGDKISQEDLDFKRPGTGISPDELKYVINRELAADLEPDQVLHWSDLR